MAPAPRTVALARVADVPGAVLAATGLVGGYAVARWTGKRQLGGVVLATAGGLAGRQWWRRAGGRTAGALSVAYLGAFAGAHPLAKKLGAWPAVGAVAGGVALTSWALADRRAA